MFMCFFAPQHLERNESIHYLIFLVFKLVMCKGNVWLLLNASYFISVFSQNNESSTV